MQPISYVSECENKQPEIPKMLPDASRSSLYVQVSLCPLQQALKLPTVQEKTRLFEHITNVSSDWNKV